MKNLLFLLWAIPCLAQTRNFPALDTTNTYTGTNIFSGPVTFGQGFVTPSITTGTIITTGPGWTKTVQCQTAPSNPPAGSITIYCDSGTGLFTAINSTGASANPGGASWANVTSGTNSNSGNFVSTVGYYDFTGTTIFRLRVGSGCTTTLVGDVCYDNGSPKMWHIWQNGADNFLLTGSAAGSYTDQDCVKLTKTGSIINLADSGGACGGSGSTSLIWLTCGGSAVSNSVTDFCGASDLSTSEVATQSPVPRAGTVSGLQCRIGGSGLSSSQTITITVRKGSAAIGAITSADTILTCQLNSTNTQGCSDLTHNFTVATGDVLDIKSVPANTPSSGTLNCSVQF